MWRELKKVLVGHKMEMRARVYRAATDKWENKGVIASGYQGGLVEPLRKLFYAITKTKPHIRSYYEKSKQGQ